MFNYLKIAQYIIDIIVDDFNDKNPSEDILTPFPQLKRKKVRYGIEIKPNVIGEIAPHEVKKTLKQYKNAKIIYKCIYG